MQTATRRPILPKPLAMPLKVLPKRLHGFVLSRLLNQVFKQEIQEGEFDFLEAKTVCINVSDANVGYRIRMEQGRFIESNSKAADLTITGTIYDYLLLITDREDPDTLFFQRYLTMDGDTGLGVHLKNMLAAVEMDQLPLPNRFRPAIDRFLSLYERFA